MNFTEICRFTPRKARQVLEKMRWPNGPVCPHCHHLKAYKLNDKVRRQGVWKCASCRKEFTVTVKTPMHRSHVPLNDWLIAIYLILESKKGFSASEFHRMREGSYETSWYLFHRIREMMDQGIISKFSGPTEIDETYVGGKPKRGDKKNPHSKRGRGTEKTPIVVVVDRNGRASSHVVKDVSAKTLHKIAYDVVEKFSTIYTDEWKSYRGLGKDFIHETVNHGANEFARGDVHVNYAESFFALLKRGIYGTYHYISKKHLHRYLREFQFRWNNRDIDVPSQIRQLFSIGEGRILGYDNLVGKAVGLYD